MIFPATAEYIDRAAAHIRSGGLAAFPTETVYGLGADAFNAKAVAEIYRLKGRPATNPLIVHIADLSQLGAVTASGFDSRLVEKLAAAFWPGPLSVVLPRANKIPDIVSGGKQTVAVRIPHHPVALDLIKSAGIPIAAPSANRSNYISPTSAQHVEAEFGSALEYILDGGSCAVGIESTVLSLVHAQPTILRPGKHTREEIESVLATTVATLEKDAALEDRFSPGMFEKHYSPRTPLCFLEQAPKDLPKKFGAVRVLGAADVSGCAHIAKTLSASGNPEEAARNLYRVLRELDELGLDLIVVEPCARTGIGAAIMDRLKRAAVA